MRGNEGLDKMMERALKVLGSRYEVQRTPEHVFVLT